MPNLLVMLALTIAAVQTTAPGYEGTWIAELNAIAYVRLELHTVNGVISGGLSLGDIELGTDGFVKTATVAPKTMSPIFDVQRRGSVVAFSRKAGRDTDRFELSVAGRDLALKCLLSDVDRQEMLKLGIPEFKPIKLKKIS